MEALLEQLMMTLDEVMHSWPMRLVQFLAFVYVGIIVVTVVVTTYVTGFRKKIRRLHSGSSHAKIRRKEYYQMWSVIERRLETEDEAQYKVAILEADHLLEKAMDLQGYVGDNLAERMAQMPQGAFVQQEQIMELHKLRNQIVREENISVSLATAREAVDTYREFLEAIGFFDMRLIRDVR